MNGPLDHIRVLELAQVASGPMTGHLLGELGADVIKVEPPEGDLWRRLPPQHDAMSAPFYAVNRGKRSVVLDLKRPSGVEVVHRLAAASDVVIENWRPGVARRLGIDLDALRAAHPGLITVSISGYGPDGPRSDERVYDPIVQGVAGATHSQAVDGRPELVTTILADKVTSLAASQAVLAAIIERSRTSKGQHISVRMLDSLVAFLWPDILSGQTFLASPQEDRSAKPTRTSAIARAGDGKFLAFNTITDESWREVCAFAERPDLYEPYLDIKVRSDNVRKIVRELEAAFEGYTRDELLKVLKDRQVPCGPVNSYEEVLEDAQVLHSGIIQEHERGTLGTVREVAPMVRLASASERWLGAAPRLGEHAEEILVELGYSADDVTRLLEEHRGRSS